MLETIVVGLIILLAGQVLIRYVLDPLYEMHKTRREIGDILLRLADTYTAPRDIRIKSDLLMEVYRETRLAAAQIKTRSYAIPFYRLFALLRLVPTRSVVNEVALKLLLINFNISNENRDPQANTAARDEIAALLRLSYVGTGKQGRP